MTVSKMFTNYAATLNGTTIDGVKSASQSSGLRTMLETSDGSYLPSFGSLVSGAPRATVTTTDLAVVLGLMHDFVVLSSSGSVLKFQRYLAGGSRSVSSDAVSAAMATGIAVLRSINMSHQGNATITYEVIGTSSDGTTSPVVFSEVAAAAVGPTTAVLYTLGIVDLGASNLEGVSSVSVNFGVNTLSEARDSDIYNTFASVAQQRPSVRVRASHIDVTALTTEDGLYVASGVSVTAQKRVEGGTITATGAVVITLGKCRVEWSAINGDPKNIDILLTPWNTVSGAAPFTIT